MTAGTSVRLGVDQEASQVGWSFVGEQRLRKNFAYLLLCNTFTSAVKRQNREVLQTESGSIFGKVRVRVLAGQGQSTHEHVRTESLFCKQKIDFGFIFGSASSDGEATGDVQEDFGGNPVALE